MTFLTSLVSENLEGGLQNESKSLGYFPVETWAKQNWRNLVHSFRVLTIIFLNGENGRGIFG